MHFMTDAFGTAGMFATLLIQNGPPWAGHDGGDFWGPWILFPILFWGGVVFLIAWTVTRIFPKGRGDDRSEAPRDSAEEILRERFARGDISAEEYQRALEILRTEAARRTSEQDPTQEPREPDDHGDETS
jgi:putative membrane protein